MIDYMEKREMFRITEFKSYLKFWEKSSNMRKLEEIEVKKKEEE